MIAEILQKPILAVLIAFLVFNLTQRRHLEHGEKKRFATLGFAGMVLLLYIVSLGITRFEAPDYLLLVPVFVSIAAGYRFRNSLFLFSLHCDHCGSPLPISKTLYYDNNLCGSCIPPTSTQGPQTVQEIDWETWIPDQDAVLCFIIEDRKVLLINKKTGLGAGKVNAPGGRIEPGETAAEAAIRECQEEVGLTPSGLEKRADLSFYFTNGFSLHCSAFFAMNHTGELTETDEADPFWCGLADLPIEKMWEDDRVWLPMALEGKHIVGRFIFDGDRMASQEISETESF